MIHCTKRTSENQCSLHTQAGEIAYLLKRSSARRTLSICIDEKADVTVSVPFRSPEKNVHDFIHQKADWIVNKIKEAQKSKDYLDQKTFDDGQAFLFLGKKYPLHIQCDEVKRARLEFTGQCWEAIVPEGLSCDQQRAVVKKKMVQWYRAQAEEILGTRTVNYARGMNVEPRTIVVRSQKRMWGCCDYNTQTISLNWQIILSPMRVVDYVIVHELCHLTVPNHSKRFWQKVAKYMPNYRIYRKWLKDNYLDMVLP